MKNNNLTPFVIWCNIVGDRSGYFSHEYCIFSKKKTPFKMSPMTFTTLWTQIRLLIPTY